MEKVPVMSAVLALTTLVIALWNLTCPKCFGVKRGVETEVKDEWEMNVGGMLLCGDVNHILFRRIFCRKCGHTIHTTQQKISQEEKIALSKAV